MLAFDLHHNGKRIARAGLKKGVLSAILTWVSREGKVPPDRLDDRDVVRGLDCRLGGLNTGRSRRHEHVDWSTPREIRLGDVITVRITRASRPDTAARRRPSHVETGQRCGIAVVRCSFCGKDRPQRRAGGGPGVVVGAQVAICIHCLGAAQLMLESEESPALHFALGDNGTCSFCFRPRRPRLLRTKGKLICDGCVKTALAAV
jgi:hypothetical protein